MLYVPEDLYNSAYYYRMSNYYYIVYTNRNCYTQYSNRYCECIDVYYNNDYLRTAPYTCNVTNITNNIDFNYLSTNWVYRSDLTNIFIITFIIFSLIVFFVFNPIKRIFGRWLKNE